MSFDEIGKILFFFVYCFGFNIIVNITLLLLGIYNLRYFKPHFESFINYDIMINNMKSCVN